MKNVTFSASDLAPITAERSAKYVVIDTEKIVYELEKKGFVLRQVSRSKNGKGMHVVRMRLADPVTRNGEILYPEIVIKNSYDKTCKFTAQMGIFRQVCTNGLTVMAPEFGATNFVTRHLGTEAQIAEEMTIQFLEQIGSIWQTQELLQKTELTDDQIVALAVRAAEIRWRKKYTSEQAAELLKVARPEDEGRDAWHILNVLEENLLKGGVKLAGMKKTPRPVTKAKANVQIGEAIFTSVLEMATVGTLSPLPFAILENLN